MAVDNVKPLTRQEQTELGGRYLNVICSLRYMGLSDAAVRAAHARAVEAGISIDASRYGELGPAVAQHPKDVEILHRSLRYAEEMEEAATSPVARQKFGAEVVLLRDLVRQYPVDSESYSGDVSLLEDAGRFRDAAVLLRERRGSPVRATTLEHLEEILTSPVPYFRSIPVSEPYVQLEGGIY